jgi:hypothetical protein
MPPALELLKPKEQEELIKSAKAGNQEALETLVERIFWGASPLCLSIEDILKINNINNKILGDLGYYYWYLITMRNAFDTFPNVANIIKILAKNSNFAPAQYIYGLMHQFGYGVSRWNTKDFTKAFKYYKKATAQQFVPAQHAMGLAYSKGIGVEENQKIAFMYFLNAAHKNYKPAQELLARCYITGTGTKPNKLEALRWFLLSNPLTSESTRKIKALLVPVRKPSSENFTLDKQRYYGDIQDTKEQVFSAVDYNNILLLLGFEVYKKTTQAIFNDFIMSYNNWRQSYLTISDLLLLKTQPGFMINNYSYDLPPNTTDIKKDSSYISNIIVNKQNFLVLGENNNKIAEELENCIAIFNTLKTQHQKLQDYCNEQQNKVLDKTLNFRTTILALKSLPTQRVLSVLEQESLSKLITKNGLKLEAYSLLAPNFEPASQLAAQWFAGAELLQSKTIDDFLIKHVAQRNQDFFELYFE